MFAVALVFQKGSSIVTEIWVDIEAQSSEEAIGIATASNASNDWRMRGYAIVNSAAVMQKPACLAEEAETVFQSSPEDNTIIEEVKPRRGRKAK